MWQRFPTFKSILETSLSFIRITGGLEILSENSSESKTIKNFNAADNGAFWNLLQTLEEGEK